jgi:hypothetical protein
VQCSRYAQAADKGQEALLIPSKHAANQCTKKGGCSCIIKVPSTALRNTAWSAFPSGVPLPAQAATASPAASNSTHLLCLM